MREWRNRAKIAAAGPPGPIGLLLEIANLRGHRNDQPARDRRLHGLGRHDVAAVMVAEHIPCRACGRGRASWAGVLVCL
jgi:hypothetical protein